MKQDLAIASFLLVAGGPGYAADPLVTDADKYRVSCTSMKNKTPRLTALVDLAKEKCL